MTSMDPTTADTIDASEANKIAREDQDVTGGFQPISGETDGADTANTQAQSTGDGSLADTLKGSEETEEEKQYPGD